jgi:hypothetical protein
MPSASLDQIKILEARDELLSVLNATNHSPFFHEMRHPEDEEIFHISRRLPEMVERFLDSIPKEQKSNPVQVEYLGKGQVAKREPGK